MVFNKPNHGKTENKTAFYNRGGCFPGYFAFVLVQFGSVLVRELKQEISDRFLDVDEHGCGIDHIFQNVLKGTFM